ncbi:MAG: hypothetical protein RIT04_84 [Candidatus Parcubacteria bacterium]|jgi:hypothetical protein
MKESSLLKSHISRKKLLDLYLKDKKSVAQISSVFACSENKINYWLSKYGVKKRNISDAMYLLKNPLGDPFSLTDPKTKEQGFLFGLGLGLYWGEGTKRGKGGVRLTNTDPKLIRKFIEFLEYFCGIDRNKLRFSIQIFSDISPEKALAFWKKELNVKREQFYKTTVVKVRGEGTYKYKSEYGGVILYFNNTKLKQAICSMIENIQ